MGPMEAMGSRGMGPGEPWAGWVEWAERLGGFGPQVIAACIHGARRGSRGMGPYEIGVMGHGRGGSGEGAACTEPFKARPWGQEPWVHGSPLKSAERA